jgi:hypothetical protein
MSATTARRRLAAAPAFRIVQVTQHWTIDRGTFYRDCVVELPDGSVRLYGIRDDLVSVAA